VLTSAIAAVDNRGDAVFGTLGPGQ